MSDAEREIDAYIAAFVQSGFDTDATLDGVLFDLSCEYGDVDEDALRARVDAARAAQRAAEATWPAETDNDRLDRAFDALDGDGFVALHRAGLTVHEGGEDAYDAADARGLDTVAGYAFYHGEDVEAAQAGHGLRVAFGAFPSPRHLEVEPAETVRAGERVRAALQAEGLTVVWDGTAGRRLLVHPFEWRRRSPARA